MTRIAARVVVFLLLGAIVNVAVAWGSTLIQSHRRDSWSLNYGYTSLLTTTNEQNWQVATLRCWGGVANIWKQVPHAVPPNAVLCSLPNWSKRPRVSPSDRDRFADWEFIELAAGWPTLTVYYSLSFDSNFSLVSSDGAIKSFVELGAIPGMISMRVKTLLPAQPLWPGFAINTIFYAAALWVMYTTPFALRRRLRVRRGLCPACAYPIGSSPVCTECGKTVMYKNVEQT